MSALTGSWELLSNILGDINVCMLGLQHDRVELESTASMPDIPTKKSTRER